jgi:thioesterase domain-containing protein
MGGLVAHEIARRLYADGQTVAFLAFVDTAVLADRAVPDDTALTEQFVADLAAEAGRDKPIGPLPVGDDRFDEFFALLRETVLPAEIGPDQLRRRLAVYRAGSAAAFTCRPAWVYPGRLDVIRAADGSSPDRADWADLASQVREYRTPGDHISLWSAENRPALAIMIDTLLGTVTG